MSSVGILFDTFIETPVYRLNEPTSLAYCLCYRRSDNQ